MMHLKDALEMLIDGSEIIKKIWAFKNALFSFQLTARLLFHQFVVIETAYWFFSIDKNSEEFSRCSGFSPG